MIKSFYFDWKKRGRPLREKESDYEAKKPTRIMGGLTIIIFQESKSFRSVAGRHDGPAVVAAMPSGVLTGPTFRKVCIFHSSQGARR
jgi:hypothetical protein